MTTTYSEWSDTWRPSGSSVDKRYRARLDTSYGYDAYTFWVTATVYVNINSSVEAYYWGRVSGSSQSTYTSSKVTTVFKESGATLTVYAIQTTYYWSRTHSAYTVAVTGEAMSDKKTWDGYWMPTTQYFTVPAKDSHWVYYNNNTGTGSIDPQQKWYGENIAIKSDSGFSKEHYEFSHWNTASNNAGTTYQPNQTYSDNGTTSKTLYAIWNVTDPPTFDDKGYQDDGVFTTPTKMRSQIGTTILNYVPTVDTRSIVSATLMWGTDSTTLSKADLDTAEGVIRLTPTTSGTNPLIIIVTDSEGAQTQHIIGDATVVEPTWTYTATYSEQTPNSHLRPNDAQFGYANMTVEVREYDHSTSSWGSWVETGSTYTTTYDENAKTWSFQITLDDKYVDAYTDSPNAQIRVTYNRQDVDESASRKPFFLTTRNANFSTGISNTMFVSGAEYTNYSSRVWWSYVNNPLYFPETNYIEVGSNDTSVMGLTKVGDYLGVVKQSKTTDTAIFLVYPTSFEDDTTYAVKQLSSGIGAYGKYTFNVLGDETLFLSPNGVMAIVPSEDNDHKVQNRSYFIDGRLLQESNLADAYSFVYEGKYYLALNEHCYVLDGNQRNSWGNDKTNLVYECYYLDNVPANCFMKYDDELYFSNNEQMCRFKKKGAGAYADTSSTESVPVRARWSTIVDDDGALHYQKTMQKKGNLVSIFPNLPVRYVEAEVTESDFNKNKKNYFTLVEEEYVRCTAESVYDANTTYYIRVRSATKIYVRKDTGQPVEIQRQFNEPTEIPSELFINKKFKKYKRLQFIVENNENEPFGVDSIIKQYTIGNYAKR